MTQSLRSISKVWKVLALSALLVVSVSGVSAASEKSVGVVFSGDLPRYKEAHEAFVAALGKAGFDQSKVTIYVQTPNPDRMSWTNSVKKFIGVDVDVIVTYGAPAALTALRESSSVPVVFSYVYDPASCGTRKQNSTGVSSKVPMVTLLSTLKSITPFSKLAVMYNPDEKDSVVQLDEITRNSQALGFQVVEVAVKSPSEARGKISKAAGGCDSVYISCSAAVGKDLAGVIGVANKNKLPTASQTSELADRGVLLALAPSSVEQGEIAARQVAQILKGAQPSAIPVETSKKVNMVLNMKTAGALSLKVPFDVLNAATKVIK